MTKPSPVIVVTGGSAGAGRAIARRFGAEGWRVGLIARDEGRLEATRREIEAFGGPAMVQAADMADAAAVFRARDAILAEWGQIDVWVNAAMVTVVGPISRVTPEEFRRVTEVTYLGYVHGSLAALEAMRPADRGMIVQVGSALAYRAIPLQAAYCAAKFAVRGFTDSLRTELRHEGSGIHMSMVQLPGMNTPQFDWARNTFQHKYRPVGAVFDPDVAADAVQRAVRSRPRELWVGGSAILAIVGQMLAPALLDRILARTAWEGQIDTVDEDTGRSDNLGAPVAGDVGARGRFGEEARPRAMMLDPETARLGVAAALVLVGLAGLAGLGRPGRA
ncbi:SDR family oxidoreductase [Brevundimonas sp.]|uniref:SDR family oxidoreductase n=1 Tax=Brevundimonas sp. TaxID=1871086 RepID=UPI003F6FDFD0